MKFRQISQVSEECSALSRALCGSFFLTAGIAEERGELLLTLSSHLPSVEPDFQEVTKTDRRK